MAAFTNKATLSYNGKTTTSNTVTGEIVGALTVTKTALAGEYAAGDTLTYVVTLANTGATDMDGVTLTDDLGAYTFNELTLVPLTYVDGSAKLFVNGAPQADPQVTAEDGLVIAGVSVPAGGSAVIVYNAALNNYAPLEAGSAIKNSVSLTSARIEHASAAEETVTAAGEPVLDITKALCPAEVEENGEITYTFVITNTGAAPAEADDNAVLADTFDPVLENISVTLNGAALEQDSDYTYDEATGEFATLPGVITVPAAEFTQDETTGEWTTVPGTVTLKITGTV